MSELLSDPPRWKDSTDQDDLAERRVGHAIRCLRGVAARPAATFSRVRAQLCAGHRRRRPTWILATAALILGAATMASAAHLDLLPAWLDQIMKPGVPARADRRPPRAKTRTAAPATPAPAMLPSLEVTPRPQASPAASLQHGGSASLPAAPLPSPAPAQAARAPSPMHKVAMVDREQHPPRTEPTVASAPVPPAPMAPAPSFAGPAPAASPADTPAVAPATAPPPLPERTRTAPLSPGPSLAPASPARDGVATYLTQAIRSLRVEHAPGEALRLLDSHDRELADGGFAHESLLLRVEALLALGRRAELLRLLDGTSLTDVAASRALLVTRGELRAAAHRCAEGIGDFDLVLARSRQSDRQALVGRALCRKHLGDVVGMRADVERLRREFPNQALPAGLE